MMAFNNNNNNNNSGYSSTPVRSQSFPGQRRDYEAINVLLLKFKFDDLQLEGEMNALEATYSGLGYDVTRYEMGMKDGWRAKKVRKRLSRFLRRARNRNVLSIVHYSGHGGCERGDDAPERRRNQFFLSSHNLPTDTASVIGAVASVWRERGSGNFYEALRRIGNPFQPVAGIYWPDISPTIMKAESDTLVILDCCCAGMATVTSQHPGALGDNMATVSNFRKELIGACGWFVDTYSDMSKALCASLDRGLPNSSRTISTHTLVRLTNNRLVQLFNTRERGHEPPQAVHYLLQRNNKNKMVLPRFDLDRDGIRGRNPAVGEAAPAPAAAGNYNTTDRDCHDGRVDQGSGYQSYRSREYLPLAGVAGDDARPCEDGGSLPDVDHGARYHRADDDAHDHSMLPDADDEFNEDEMEVASPRMALNRRISPAREFRGIDAEHEDATTSAFVEAMLIPYSCTTGKTATQATARTDTPRNEAPAVRPLPGRGGEGLDVCDGVSLSYDPKIAAAEEYFRIFDDDEIMGAQLEDHNGAGGTAVPQSPGQDMAAAQISGRRQQQQPVPAHLRSSLDKYPDHPWRSPSP
ncbi:hypothetical protein QBC42DRAFT_351021 [Cladorrhinum samala]|uniref:Uncharacterized protein n=1 Tax=Cladorrhinum samala TaxID=585594 RepID=A0AAV9HA37_9PEZI|nr:hypothetical protein QBC42DRAFT_351021 [Cladorrhinum samala]